MKTIETEPLCVSSSNLTDLIMTERMNRIDFRSKFKITTDMHGTL